MCLPAAAAVAIMAVSAAVSAYGAYQTSQANKDAANYQAQVAQNNAQIASWNAQDALDRGQRAEADQRLKNSQFKGDQRASLAARGLDLGEGSPVDILATTDFMGERDALTIRDNAAKEAWGYRIQGNNANDNANLLRARADAENPTMAAGMSLLGSAGSVASKWYGSGMGGGAS